MRNHLHGAAEIVAAPLFGDDGGVDAAGGDGRIAGQIDVHEPLVMAQIQVGLRAVVGDEDFAVLVRVHRPGIHIDVGIELGHGDAEAPVAQQAAQAGGRDAFADGRDDAAGDENILSARLTTGRSVDWVDMALLIKW